MQSDIAKALEESQVLLDKGEQFLNEMNESYKAVQEKLIQIPVKTYCHVDYEHKYISDGTELQGGRRIAFAKAGDKWGVVFEVFKCVGVDGDEGFTFAEEIVEFWPLAEAPLRDKIAGYSCLLDLFKEALNHYQECIGWHTPS
jgi:hypothetical protein